MFTSLPASIMCFVIGLLVFIALSFSKRMPRIIAVMISALIMSLGIDGSILTTMFSTLIEGTMSVIGSYLWPMIAGAIVGTAMAASGCADALAVAITKALGAGKGLLAIMVVSALVCASGVYEPAFIVLPIALSICRESNIPRGVAMLAFVAQVQIIQFNLVGIPSFPQILPAQILGTTIYNHPLMSICVCICAEILVYTIAHLILRHDAKRNKGFEEVPEVKLFATPEKLPEEDLPSVPFSILPLVFMIGGAMLLSQVFGLESIPSAVLSQTFTVLFLVITRRKKWHSTMDTDSILVEFGASMERIFPMLITVGFIGGMGTVISKMTWYEPGIEWAFTLKASPYFLAFLIVAIVCFITCDAIAGMQMFLSTVGERFLAIPGIDKGALMRVVASTSCSIESMPWTAGCYQYCSFFGLSLKSGWKYHFIGTVGITTFMAVFYTVWSTIAWPC